MSSREAFEAWLKEQVKRKPINLPLMRSSEEAEQLASELHEHLWCAFEAGYDRAWEEEMGTAS